MVSIASLFHTALLVVLTIAAFLISALIMDAALRQWYGSKVELVSASTTGTSAKQKQCLVIYLPGILAHAQSSSGNLGNLWRRYGDVLFVEYQGKRFRDDEVAKEVASFINNHPEYREIRIIGSSMGGRLGHMVIRRLDKATQDKIRFFVLDAPMSARDFQSPLDKQSRTMYLPFGPIYSFLAGPIVKAMMRPPKEQNVAHGVKQETLDERVREMRSFRLMKYRDQVYSMISGEEIKPGSLSGIKQLVYFESEWDDDTVRPTAFDGWNRAFNGNATRRKVKSTHVAFFEQPDAWWRAFEEEFETVP